MSITTVVQSQRSSGQAATRRFRVAVNVVVSGALVSLGAVRDPGLLVGLSVAAAIGVSCEALAPPPGGRPSKRRSLHAYATDLTHAIGNRYLILPLVTAAAALIGPFVADVVPSGVGEGFAVLPGWAQVVLILVMADFMNYWSHRALHQVPWLWRFHAVHHSTERLDWLATSRGHPIDLVFAILTISFPAFALGRVAIAPWILTFFFIYPFVCHSDTRIEVPYVSWILVTPKFHHWHHADDPMAYDRNFGAILSIWDRLFGSVIEPADFPDRYGIAGSQLNEADYVGHLIIPFLPSRFDGTA